MNEPTRVQGPYAVPRHPRGRMKLQVFAILENGVSKLLPKQADTLRVLLILPNDAAPPRSESDEGGPRPPARRRRGIAALAPPGA